MSKSFISIGIKKLLTSGLRTFKKPTRRIRADIIKSMPLKIIKQPAYKDKNYRVVGQIPNADVVMNSTFWIGVYPGLSENMINYVIEKIETFLE